MRAIHCQDVALPAHCRDFASLRAAPSLALLLVLTVIAASIQPVHATGNSQGTEALAAPILNAAAVSPSQIRVSVAAVPGAASYRIEAADNAGFENAEVLAEGEGRVVIESGLTAGRRRYYRVRAQDRAGETSPWSIVRWASPVRPTYPADEYDVATGFGLRKLAGDYEGAAIEVKRLSDGAVRDIGFVGRELDVVAIEAFAEGSDLVVTKFYDQVDAPGAYVPEYSSDLPRIAVAGSVLLDETTGRPYVDMAGGGAIQEKYFQREKPLSSPVRKEGSAVLLCVEVREQASGDHNQGGFGPGRDCRVPGSLGTWQGRFATKGTLGDPTNYQHYTRHRTWHGGLFLDGSQRIFAGTKVVAEASEGMGDSYERPQLLAGNPWRFSEALIFTGVTSPEEYRRRLWSADRYWRVAPTQRQYGLTDKIECQYRFQGEIIEWLSERTGEDFVVHAIRSVGEKQLTVEGVDWTHLKPGHTIYAHDRKLTLAAAPTRTEDGKHTVLTVAEPTRDAFTPGQQIVFRPQYDGSYTDPEQAANLKTYLQTGGDGSLAPGLNGRADPRWYAWDTGQPPMTPEIVDWAVLDETRPGEPESRPAKLRIRGTAGASNHKIALLRISLENLSDQPSATTFSFYNNALGSEDGGKPYIGVQVYEDLAWDSRSLRWDTMPEAIDLDRKYDDIEGITEGREERAYLAFNLTDRIQAARENGASSVTLVFYNCGHQYGRARKTKRTVFLDGPAAEHAPRIHLYRAYGLVATGQLRVPDIIRGAYNYGGGWQVAAWTRPAMDFPYHGGRGNPFAGNAAMKRRALVVDMVNAVQLTTAGNIYDWTRYYGGYLLSLAHSLRLGGDVLPYEVRQAAKQAMLHLAESGRRYPYDAGANSNMDVRSAEGAMAAYALFDAAESDAREQLLESARFILLGDRDGHPTTDEAIWHKEGNIYEGRTPEGSYNNRSLSHLVDGRAVVWDEPAWQWVDLIIRRMARFQERQFGIQPSGRALDASGYSGRTIDAVLGGQYHSSSKLIMGVLYPEARWHLRNWGGAGEFLVAKSGDAAARGAKEQIDRLGHFTVITAIPPAWSGRSSWQARAPEPPPVAGWWRRALQWRENDAPELYPVFHPDSQRSAFAEALPEDGHSDWFILKAGQEGEHWGAFIDVRAKSGAYGGGFGGVHMLWSEGYGVVLSSRRPGGSPAEDKLMDGVIGRDDDGKLFSFYQKVRDAEAATKVDLQEAVATHSYRVRGKKVLSDGASWDLQRAYTKLSRTEGDEQDGLRIDLTMTYKPGAAPPDRIDALWWSLPIAAGVKNDAPELELSYWDSDAWVRIPPHTPTAAKEWKLTRNGSSFWLRFASPATVELLSRKSANRTVGHPLLINLHPDEGETTAAIPARIRRSLTLTRTDPGYEGTAVSPSLSFPKNGETLPVGGLWQIRGELDVPEAMKVKALFFEYSTDGGDAWSTIASLAPESGEKIVADAGRIRHDGEHVYTYVGDDVEIPEGLTDIRIRSAAESERSQTFRVSSGRPRLVVREDFTVDQDASFDGSYELDVNETGKKLYVPKGKVIVDAASGTATATEHNSWFNQVRINVGTVNFITSLRLKSMPSGGGGAGLLLRSGSYYQNVRGVLSGGRLKISEVMNTFAEQAADLDASKEYVLTAQSIGSTVTFSVWNSDRSALLARYTRFGDNPGGDAVGFGFKSSEVRVDDWMIETFSNPKDAD